MNKSRNSVAQAVAAVRHMALSTAAALPLLTATLPAAADSPGGAHEPRPAAAAKEAADEFVNAEVRKIDKEGGKLTLKHEAIRQFDMAGMTMAFRVAEPAMLDGLAVGDRVRFIPDKRNGQFVIRQIDKLN